MDEADQSVKHQAFMLHVAIQNAKNKPVIKAKGRCYNCRRTLKEGSFCDSDCAEDYDKIERAKLNLK